MTEEFAKALSGEDEVRVSFVRSNGKKRTIPVWFTLEGRTLELLPMHGLKTKWYMDVEKDGKLQVQAKDEVRSVSPRVVQDVEAVERIKKRFALKYGEDDVRRYYPTSEVALEVQV